MSCNRKRQQRPLRILDSSWRAIGNLYIILKLLLLLYFVGHPFWTEVFINTSINWEIWWLYELLICSFIMYGGGNILYEEPWLKYMWSIEIWWLKSMWSRKIRYHIIKNIIELLYWIIMRIILTYIGETMINSYGITITILYGNGYTNSKW